MRPETRDTVDAYWAESLDCSRETLLTAGVSVVGGDSGTAGITKRGDSAVVSATPDRLDAVRSALSGLNVTDVVDADVLTEKLVEVDDGGAGRRRTSRPRVPQIGRRIDARHRRDRRSNADRGRQSSLRNLPERLLRRRVGRRWPRPHSRTHCWYLRRRRPRRPRRLRGVGRHARTHRRHHSPDHRNAGHEQDVVATVANHALDAGLVPQYRTLDEWPWSVQVATTLGFERWGTSVLVLSA